MKPNGDNNTDNNNKITKIADNQFISYKDIYFNSNQDVNNYQCITLKESLSKNISLDIIPFNHQESRSTPPGNIRIWGPFKKIEELTTSNDSIYLTVVKNHT